MKRIIGIGLLLLSFAVIALADDKPTKEPTPGTYSVVVTGKSTHTADQVEIKFNLSSNSDEASTAQKKFDKKLKVLRDIVAGKQDLPKVDDDTDDEENEEEKPAPKKKPKNGVKPKKNPDDDGCWVPEQPNEDSDEKDAKQKKKRPNKKNEIATVDSSVSLTLHDGGISVSYFPAMQQRFPGQQLNILTGYVFSAPMTLTLKGISAITPAAFRVRLASLLDTLTDTGLCNNETEFSLHFKVKDGDDPHQATLADAMKQARQKIETMAKLTGNTPGRIVSAIEMQENNLNTKNPTNGLVYNPMTGRYERNRDLSFSEIQYEVTLSVLFELEPGPRLRSCGPEQSQPNAAQKK